MRELIEMNKKEKNARFSVLIALIKEQKKLVREELRSYRKLAKGIKKSKMRLEAGERSYERFESKRSATKIKTAIRDRDALTAQFNALAEKIVKDVSHIRRDYIAMAHLFFTGRTGRIMNRCENYVDSVVWNMMNIQLHYGINENIEYEEEY